MKSSAKSYAKALFELTEKASKLEIKNIISKFLRELQNQQMLSKVDEILIEFGKLSDQAEGIVRATITSVHKVSKTSLDEATKLVLKKIKGTKVAWTEIIDPEILGGVSIHCGDFIIDMSLANRVSELSARIKE